ncbi:hypothetical protein [Pseudoalteromonas sp. BDTF-M6]|uniref:hypothetical protein n=1 Tax=Pseudoalteromonas sp. BDTF-M6 TaxID=2796132 RepID=UPI001BAE79C0|nr:hypothetical protein [Pseudoalteromonas sp. BDTF-M6]MBS3798181.1 hypothetical protein [Pseudoalteromonas sp. BDTF-M6]
MNKTNRWLLPLCTSLALLASTPTLAKSYLNIEVADEILALGEEYELSLSESIISDKNHMVNKKLLTFLPEDDKVFYEFTLSIKKGEKVWISDVFVFSNQKNFLDFNTLLFSELVDESDFYHLDHKAGYNFFSSYSQHIPKGYEKLKAEYDKGLPHYFSYTSASTDYQAYLANIYPLSEKLKKAVKDTRATKVTPHEEVIERFVRAINSKRSAPLLKYRDPKASQKNQDIYKRGLQTLFAYFDKIGNPSKFEVVQHRRYENINQPSVDYYLINLLEHNGALSNRVEMEFFFSDVHGKRYIKEYDITGIHFE